MSAQEPRSFILVFLVSDKNTIRVYILQDNGHLYKYNILGIEDIIHSCAFCFQTRYLIFNYF